MTKEGNPFQTDLNNYKLTFTTAQIQTQSYCNGSCVICPYKQTSQALPQGRMSRELFCKIVDDLVTYRKLKLISLMLQNEPLLNENLEDEIRYVKKKNREIKTSITTNGYYLTKNKAEQLAEAGLDILIFSINGLTKETFHKVQKNLEFDTIYNNLIALITNKPARIKIVVKSMLIKPNALELGIPEKFSNLPQLLREHNIGFNVGPISNRAGSLTNYDKLIVFEDLQDSKQKTICNDIFDTINILFNGDMISCCADWNRESVLGNLKKHTIQEIMLGKEAMRRKKLIMEGKYNQLLPCENCNQAINIMANRQNHTS